MKLIDRIALGRLISMVFSFIISVLKIMFPDSQSKKRRLRWRKTDE